ncbi:unnamed protein product, partial [Symbiodinium sp. KB8]
EERCEDLRKRFAERSAELAVHAPWLASLAVRMVLGLGLYEADDKAQLAKRAAGMNMCRWCFHSFTETVERIESRLGDQVLGWFFQPRIAIVSKALAAGSFKSGLEMVRQTIEKLRTTVVPACHAATSQPVEQIRSDLRAVEDELVQLKSRTEHLESCAARRPPPVEILRAAALTDVAPKPEEVAGKLTDFRRTLLEADAEEMPQSEEHGPGGNEVPQAAFTTLKIALDSFEEVLLQADARPKPAGHFLQSPSPDKWVSASEEKAWKKLESQEQLWTLALEQLQEMECTGVQINTIAINAAIDCCAKAAHWEAALALFASMSSRQLEVSCVTFGAAATAMEEASLWLE